MTCKYRQPSQRQYGVASIPPSIEKRNTLLLEEDVCFCLSVTRIDHIYIHKGKISLTTVSLHYHSN